MNIRLMVLLSAGFVTALIAGCSSFSVGPDYGEPEMAMPDAWHHAIQQDLDSGAPDLQTWWKVFGDEVLDGLIARAATNNLTLQVASARIEQAAALRGVSSSQWFPEIVASGSASAVQTTERQTPPGSDREGELYRAGLAMSWELDLWGRIRRSVESADASLQASVENHRDIMVVLYAEIASTYINLRTLQERLHFAHGNLEAQTETLRLTNNRFDAGLVPALDVSQAELNRSRTASLIPPLRQQLVESVNRLSVLTGDMPYALQQTLEQRQPIPVANQRIVAGLPAELVRQRPDIRRAERELAAQNALIGATQAELYPTLALPGTLTLEAPNSDLFDGGNAAYSLGPQLRWNIFNGRRIRSRVDAERAATKAALLGYEQTVLLALEEVEGALAAYANETDRIVLLQSAEEAARKSVLLVNELYSSGLTDFQNVLITQQSLFEQQDQLAASRGRIAANMVAIYRALGGGWNMAVEE